MIKYYIQNRKGQTTVWIIVSLVIVAIIGFLFFINYSPLREGGEGLQELEVKNYIDKCARENAEIIADKMIMHGGFIQPTNFKFYNNISIEYLCRNVGYFKPCTNQHPAYISEMEKELTMHLAPTIQKCFEDLDKQLTDKNAVLITENSSTEVLFAPGKIIINIQRNMSAKYREQNYEYSNFNSDLNYPIYNLANAAREVANNEANYCYFEYAGYMILHPELKISKVVLGDNTKIYQIEYIDAGKKLNFGIRGCAIPPGI